MNERERQIIEEFQRRRRVRGSLVEWARHCGFEPQSHHRLLITELEKAAREGEARLIFCLPPGAAKSTYISRLFPPWFLAQRPHQSILACSYAKDLIVGHARVARNYVEQHSSTLEIALKSDTKAADEWETTNSGRFFCAGVNAGIAGHRADLAFIDDPIGSDEDARSQNYRDKQWSWFWDDFIPRLQPGGSVIILANRRHEADLVGSLLATDSARWKHIKVPLVIDTETQAASDPLGRKVGERLWPSYYTDLKLSDARRSENFSGLYQQDPSPEEGDLIKREWLVEHQNPNEYPAKESLRWYCGSDHALTTKEENDSNCLLPGGVDSQGDIWISPRFYWGQCDSGQLAEEMLTLGGEFHFVSWFAENEHIHKAIGPFLKQLMLKRRVFLPLVPLTSSRDLVTRSSSIRGFMRFRKVHFPAWDTRWHLAKHQMLSFPKGKHDDFVAALSELGQGLASMTSFSPPPSEPFDSELKQGWRPTMKWMREQDAARRAHRCERFQGR